MSQRAVEQMWRIFCLESGIDETEPHEAWAFCGGSALGDELAELVLRGVKTATASAYIAYETEKEPLPVEGQYSIILYDDGRPACVIRSAKVTLVPFDEVSSEHAFREGEGSRTLEEWRDAHRAAFAPDYAAAGKEFDERGLVVLEEFVRVFP